MIEAWNACREEAIFNKIPPFARNIAFKFVKF